MNKKQMPVSTSTAENSHEAQALSLLNSGKYKDAIELYKKLVQNSDNSEWRQRLAYCYLQRALAFAAKGMFKEALVLWENYRQQSQPPYQYYDHYLAWLIQTGNPARIQSGLGQLSAQQLDKEYPALTALLGLLIITDHPEFQQALPQDSAIIAHLNVVQSALQAYQADSLAEVDDALKPLPYRSAFRDFRTLLKASIAASTSLSEAQPLLAKIPANSPYSQTAELLLACTRKGSALARDMEKFNHPQRRLIGEIIGLNKKQLEFIEILCTQKDRLSDKIKFNLAIQYQSLCGSDLTQRFCSAMLTRYPAGQREFTKNFGSIDAFEENRIMALSHERNNNNYDADYYWRQCIRALRHDETENGGLKTALILRRLAQNQSDEEQARTLIESLEYDPNDRDSYLQILGYYSRHRKTADAYKQWLSKTLDRFPLDIDVLSLATREAMGAKAYKKAGQYALNILKIDPLNSFAKQTLCSSHLASARQLMQTRKLHLVEKEIRQAEDLRIGKRHALQTELMRGLLCFAAQDKKQGLQRIADALNKLNKDPVNATFQGAMEALLTNLPVATLLRELPPATDHILSAPELTRFIQLLTQYEQEDSNRERLHKALEKVKAPLKKSVQQQNYDENLLLALCQTLDTVNHFELLRHCAKWAQSKWNKPIWMYYRIYSETHGEPERCTFMNSLRLERNHAQARQDKDHRAMTLIGNYLDRYHQAHPSMGMGLLESLFNQEKQDDFEEPLDTLFGHLPEEVFHTLNKKLESLSKNTSPERLVQELIKAADQRNTILNAMMQDPALFTALMILKAANESGINIDVSVDDVLDCFGVIKKAGPFPY